MAFSEGVTNKQLVGKLETHNVETVSELFALADKCARNVEAHARVKHRGATEEPPARDRPKPGVKTNKRKAAAVLAAEGRLKLPKENPTGGERRPAPACQDGGKWCELHHTDRHDLTECRLIKDLATNHLRGRDERRRDDRGDHDCKDHRGVRP
jgi:hypothetical protein